MMESTRSDDLDEAALDRALALLGSRLEASEAGRAWRQLVATRRHGGPAEDDAPLRHGLLQDLGATAYVALAYEHLAWAIAQLRNDMAPPRPLLPALPETAQVDPVKRRIKVKAATAELNTAPQLPVPSRAKSAPAGLRDALARLAGTGEVAANRFDTDAPVILPPGPSADPARSERSANKTTSADASQIWLDQLEAEINRMDREDLAADTALHGPDAHPSPDLEDEPDGASEAAVDIVLPGRRNERSRTERVGPATQGDSSTRPERNRGLEPRLEETDLEPGVDEATVEIVRVPPSATGGAARQESGAPPRGGGTSMPVGGSRRGPRKP